MKLRILHSSIGDTLPRQYHSTYLLNGVLAVDAGYLGLWSDPEAQTRIRDVLLTHSHMDHIATLPVFLENAFEPALGSVTVHGLSETLQALRLHVFNGVLWPDFLSIAPAGVPLLRLQPLEPRVSRSVAGLQVTAVPVNHPIPACGFVITDGLTTVVFGGDSGPTDEIWKLAALGPRPRTVVMEVSFPDRLADMGKRAGHLTPGTFAQEIGKLPTVERVIVVHLKEKHRLELQRELDRDFGVPVLLAAAEAEYEV